MKAQVAYQIYSARDEAAADLQGVLMQIHEIGYDGVEFAGFYGHDALEVKAWLQEIGLTAISSHVPFPLLENDLFATVAYHQVIGCSYMAVPYLDETQRPGGPGFAAALRTLYHVGKVCRKAGIQLLYHNHDFEFETLSGQHGLDFLYDATPPQLLQAEIDTCWVHYSSLNPADYIRQYTGRVPIVHLKDYVGARGKERPYALIQAGGGTDQAGENVQFCFKPVGYGCLDVQSVVDAGLEAGASWFVVEQDLSPERPPLEAAKMSLEYLRSIGL